VAPLLGAVLGWLAHAVAVKGQTSFSDDIQHIRREAT
jgi:hypothetical protein